MNRRNTYTFTDQERAELVRRYAACASSTDKQQLAVEYGLPSVQKLENLNAHYLRLEQLNAS